MVGWQEYAVADEGERAMQVIPPGVPHTLALNVLGLTGMTAYFGMLDVGEVKEGDVVVVSGAAGRNGLRRGPDRRSRVRRRSSASPAAPRSARGIVDELGFDAAIDYKSEDVGKRLARRPRRSTSTSTT